MKKRVLNTILILILSFSFFTRIYGLEYPSHYMFDEVYHGITAQLISQNDPRAFEWWHPEFSPGVMIDWLHPPIAKYTQALSIFLFGHTSFGWRLSSALFGVGVVYLTYVLATNLWNKKVGLLAGFFASMDGLLLVQSRIAMNDIHVTFFTLATLITYIEYRRKGTLRWLVGTLLMSGITIATKWSGLYVLLAILLSEMYFIFKEIYIRLRKEPVSIQILLFFVKKYIPTVLLCILIPATVYISSYALMFAQGKNIDHFILLHRQIWAYQTSLEATHTYQSRPWQWFLNTRPVWYHVEHMTDTSVKNIYAFGNPILHIVGVGVILLLISNVTKHFFHKEKESAPYVTWLLAMYFLLWVPWHFSPRIMFYYHYAPAVPLLCILIAYYLSFKTKPIVVKTVIFLTSIAFLIWYPHWTAIAAPEWLRSIYTLFETWK